MLFSGHIPWLLVVSLLTVLQPGTRAAPAADASPDPRGLSSKFHDNKPYLRGNATMSFDVKTGDLIPAHLPKQGRVISSVRLLIQVVNGTVSMSNKTIAGTNGGSRDGEDDGDLDASQESSERSSGDASSFDTSGTEEDGADVADDLIEHISDENGERVNVSLGRENVGHTGRKVSSGAGSTNHGGKSPRSSTAASVPDVDDNEEEEEHEGGLTGGASGKVHSAARGGNSSGSTSAGGDDAKGDSAEDGDAHDSTSEDCDCDENGNPRHPVDQTESSGETKKGQKTDLQHTVEEAENDDEKETGQQGNGHVKKPIHAAAVEKSENDDEKETGQQGNGHVKKPIHAAAVVSDDKTAQVSLTAAPPLRRRPTGKLTRHTSTQKSAGIHFGDDEHEREDQDSDVDSDSEEGAVVEDGSDTDEDTVSGGQAGKHPLTEGGKQAVCFGDWTDWTACKPVNRTHSVRERARFKLLSDTDPEPEMNLQTQNCEDSELALISGFASEWSSWSECSKTCDGGVQLRFRSAIGSSWLKEDTNRDSLTETRPCGQKKCIRITETPTFHGDWSSWSSCSRSCGGGIQTRFRQCLLVSAAQYVSDPDRPVVEAVTVPQPRPVPRQRCVSSSDLPAAGVQLAACAVVFCEGELALVDERYHAEVLYTTTSSPVTPSPYTPLPVYSSSHLPAYTSESLPVYTASEVAYQTTTSAYYPAPMLPAAQLPPRIQSQQRLPLSVVPAGPPQTPLLNGVRPGPPQTLALPGPPQTLALPGPPQTLPGPPQTLALPGPPQTIPGPPQTLAGPPQTLAGPPQTRPLTAVLPGAPPTPPFNVVQPGPPMLYQVVVPPPAYMSYVTAAPLNLDSARQYQLENQVDYSDYDERH